MTLDDVRVHFLYEDHRSRRWVVTADGQPGVQVSGEKRWKLSWSSEAMKADFLARFLEELATAVRGLDG